MTNKGGTRKNLGHRLATIMAAVGALLISSGIVLMVTPTSASAGEEVKKVNVCHATDSDTNPYEGINVSLSAVKDEGHLAHRTTPNKTWTEAGFWNGVFHAAGSAKRDYIESFTDGDSARQVLDGTFGLEFCDAEVTLGTAVATATPVDPTCADLDGSYATTTVHATFASLPPAVPGDTIHLTATADAGYTFGGSATLDVPVTLQVAPTNCAPPEVIPPDVSPPTAPAEVKSEVTTSTTTPTVVEAGLAGDTAGSSDTGLGLLAAGLLLLAGAGALVLRRSDS